MAVSRLFFAYALAAPLGQTGWAAWSSPEPRELSPESKPSKLASEKQAKASLLLLTDFRADITQSRPSTPVDAAESHADSPLQSRCVKPRAGSVRRKEGESSQGPRQGVWA